MNGSEIRIKPVYLALVILGAAVYLSGLFTDVFIDAGKYAAVSRGIADSGDLVHVKIMSEPYLQKPPFLFWLAALSIKIFGISNFAFKFPTFLFSMLGFYSTYRLGKLLYGQSTGIVAAVMLAFSQAMFLYNNDTHTDTVLTSCIIFSIWQLYEYYRFKRIGNYFLSFLSAGCAMITKGPVGVIIPLVAFGGHILLIKDYRSLFSWKWIPGIVIIFGVTYPVLNGLYDQFGMGGMKFFFWTNNMGRITGDYAGDSTDYSFYIHTFSYIFLPWSLISFFSFYMEALSLYRAGFRLTGMKEFICWSGILFFLIIFSIAKMKSPHYMLPVIPLISILTAKWIVRIAEENNYLKKGNVIIILQNIIGGILIFLTAFILFVSFPGSGLPVTIAFLLLVIFFVYISFIYRKNRYEKILLSSLTAIAILNLIFNTVLLPGLNRYHAAARASELFNELSPDEAVLHNFGYDGFEMGFYAKNQGKVLHKPDLGKLARLGDTWIFTTEGGLDIIRKMDIRYEVIAEFPYIKLSNINFNMLLPDSREKEAQATFLIILK
ncbi:MAG TPA: glycosyltransferase family 39 protein [Cyclobacteriaceae bacterium]|nr:glycosyltransferase family 39 protein [Cyclobacteriaceae bacterium]